MDTETKVDRSQVIVPTVTFSDTALSQLKLIIENDFTLAGKFFRLLISGKGCDGFTYSVGFTDLKDDDFTVKINNDGEDLEIVVDPFAAFYLQETSVDFVQDFENDNEGFVVTNHGQSNFRGKFWRKNEDRVPPMKDA